MAGELVLLTGGTGFLGYAILLDLLKSGYRVRVAARSQAKIDKIRAAPSISAWNPPPSQLMFVLVPDMTIAGAYDSAVDGVDFIIHAAAPTGTGGEDQSSANEKLEDVFIKASVAGNLGILKSAHEKGKRMRRIVMTSSTVAIAPADVYVRPLEVEQITRGPENRVTVPEPPYSSQLHAYCAAKAASLSASETFIRDNTTAFDLISIIPSWIFGKNELVSNTKDMCTGSANALMSGLLTGSQTVPSVGNAVLCADVARSHVRALDSDVKGNQSFIVNTEAKWEDTVSIAKKYFPDAFTSGLFREDGRWSTIPLKWDSSKVRRLPSLTVVCVRALVNRLTIQILTGARHHGD